jgi:chromatin modification-related protein VID21
MAMKMIPQPGMQQSIAGRPGLPPQASPDNARIIREASRLQEQQRIVQSRQQQHQLQNQQGFVSQGPHASPNMNMASLGTNPSNPAMLAAFQAATGVGSPSFHTSALAQSLSSASPRMSQPNPLSNGVVPTISSFQSSIQRSNPNMPPDQVTKLATERLHQYQQRMSQVAMNAAAGNIGSIPASYQMPHDGNLQALSQPGIPSGAPAIQNPQTQGYSPLMRVTQTGQQSRMGVGGSPAMNGMVLQQSRSATPQTHRSGSAPGGPVPGSGKSPRPPQVQMATG